MSPNEDLILKSGVLVFFSVALYWEVLRHTKDYFSFITITENGVTVTFLGRPWFEATWSEIEYIGEFDLNCDKHSMECMYLSKLQVPNDLSIIRGETPSSAEMVFMTVFIDLSSRPKLRAELMKYIREEQIIKSEYRYARGLFRGSVLKKK